ncbi:hypothetical protein DFH28DRAFT_1131445 [Melampsora americana]|nr:hypothetical protein DFH28DRAFT_1131445 [Melampsora americana]
MPMRISGNISITGHVNLPSRPVRRRSAPANRARRTPPPPQATRNWRRVITAVRSRVMQATPNGDPLFWKKIFSLPEDFVEFLSPNCNLRARSTTCGILRAIVLHFVPNHVFPTRMLKQKVIGIFRAKVLRKYGPFVGL